MPTQEEQLRKIAARLRAQAECYEDAITQGSREAADAMIEADRLGLQAALWALEAYRAAGGKL